MDLIALTLSIRQGKFNKNIPYRSKNRSKTFKLINKEGNNQTWAEQRPSKRKQKPD